MSDLPAAADRLFAQGHDAPRDALRDVFQRVRAELSAGRLRVAEPDPASPAGWRLHAWIVRAVGFGVRCGELAEMGVGRGRWPLVDVDTLPMKALGPADGVRLVPGGSSVRDGAWLAPGVVCLPPSFVDIGARVDAGARLESHVLAGAGVQVGRGARVGAGALLTGVPGMPESADVDTLPAIVEDDVVIGGQSLVGAHVIVGRGAVLAAGTRLVAGAGIYDLARERVLAAADGGPLVVPAGAVVVPGSRAVRRGGGAEWGLSLAVPVIVGYRGEGADVSAMIDRWI